MMFDTENYISVDIEGGDRKDIGDPLPKQDITQCIWLKTIFQLILNKDPAEILNGEAAADILPRARDENTSKASPQFVHLMMEVCMKIEQRLGSWKAVGFLIKLGICIFQSERRARTKCYSPTYLRTDSPYL